MKQSVVIERSANRLLLLAQTTACLVIAASFSLSKVIYVSPSGSSGNSGTNFALGGDLNSGQEHVLKNNILLSGNNTIANATEENNTWNSQFSVSEADFESLDTSLSTAQRSTDGKLPETQLFRLNSTSDLVDAGVDVGLSFNGKAPDLGPFETDNTSTIDILAKSYPSHSSLRCSYDAVYRAIEMKFSLAKPGMVKITVYDISGKIVVHAVQFMGVEGANSKKLTADHLHHGFSIIHVQKPDGLLSSKLIR